MISSEVPTTQKSSRRLRVSPNPSLDSELEYSLDENSDYSASSSDSEAEIEVIDDTNEIISQIASRVPLTYAGYLSS